MLSAVGSEPAGLVGLPIPLLPQFLQHPGVTHLTSRSGGQYSAAPSAPSPLMDLSLRETEPYSQHPGVTGKGGRSLLLDNSDLSARTEYTE